MTGALLAQAELELARGEIGNAITALRAALDADPELARAHAVLARALLRAGRVAGARAEAELALALAPEAPIAHLAMAAVCVERRDLAAAARHAERALGDSYDVDAHLVAARIRVAHHDLDGASEHLAAALALATRDPRVLAAHARLALARGDLPSATSYATRAVAAAPRSAEANVAAGHVALARGDAEAAERHARAALHTAVADDDWYELWGELQTRRNPLVGAWWRVTAFFALRPRIGFAIGSYLVVRLLIIAAYALGLDGAGGVLTWVWLAFCVYTWIAPDLIKRAMRLTPM